MHKREAACHVELSHQTSTSVFRKLESCMLCALPLACSMPGSTRFGTGWSADPCLIQGASIYGTWTD